MDIEIVRELAAAHLPRACEPLLLSFAVADAPDGTRVAIGDDDGTTLYCDLSDGRILSVDSGGKLPTRFVNSGIPQLARCIAAYEAMRQRGRQLETDAEWLPLIQALRARILEIDAPALGDPDDWWSTILEQTQDGLL